MMDYETGEHSREKDYTKPYLSGFPGPVNLGNPEEISILEIAKKIVAISGSRSDIIFRKLPEDDPHRRCPDITKAKQLLKWKPSVRLDEGLVKTIEYFSKRLKKK